MTREYYSNSIPEFLKSNPDEILGILVRGSEFSIEETQRDAWTKEIAVLQQALRPFCGSVYFEYSIPRMGKRIDVILLIGPAIFILEFKVGEKSFPSYALDQVWDYALDLKNFHEPSHKGLVVPILIATEAECPDQVSTIDVQEDGLVVPVRCNSEGLGHVITLALQSTEAADIDRNQWEKGRYQPTPTIIEAAMALYSGHSVSDISRSDAGAINLRQTSDAIAEIIISSRNESRKSVCFVTGVPGAGKTLVGLNIATQNFDKNNDLYSVFLSGNGPLVAVLREALARNRVHQEKEKGSVVRKGDAMRDVKAFIQNVHNFRDECLVDPGKPPIEHVALFDEAQRAWDLEQTASFMERKKGKTNFAHSEPEFLISCLGRHKDWAVIVCLVGGGQEINTGEAGISEWIDALNRSFPDWRIYISSQLSDSEYGAGKVLDEIKLRPEVTIREELHLSVSMRSFRSELVSLLVKQILDLNADAARSTQGSIDRRYPIVLTRDASKAKQWLRDQARGSERYGILASSQAQRLKPLGVNVRAPADPIHWFLDGKDDVRSAFYLEDVATEFDVQGLELDWACVMWDADFRYSRDGWEYCSFLGDGWNHIRKIERQNYLKNAYRVLLTRARQGMVIVVPEGDGADQTRKPAFYDATFNYLRTIGFHVI